MVRLNDSFYYIRPIEYVTDRLDFYYSSPHFDEIKKFRGTSKVVPFQTFIIEDGIDYGLTASGKDSGKIKFINTENILDDGTIDDTDIKFVDECPTKLLLKENDVLITRSRKIGFCGIVTNKLEGGTYGSYIIRFRIRTEKLNPLFLAEFFNSNLGKLQTDLLKTGSSGENINSEQLSDVRIPNLDMQVQLEILEKIRPLQNEIKEFQKNEKELLNEREIIFISFLGIKEFQEKELSYYSAPINYDRLDFVFSNPKYRYIEDVITQSKFKFEDIALHVKFHDETINPTEQPEKEYAYMDIGNIDIKLGRINAIKMLGKEMTSSRMRRLVKNGYVLISTTRPTRKAIAIVPEELDGQICSTGFAVTECNPELLNEFLFYFLRTDIAKLQFERFCTGSGYPAINQDVDLPKLKIPLPPAKEQEQIINKLKELDLKIEKLNDKIQEIKKSKDALFESLIHNSYND